MRYPQSDAVRRFSSTRVPAGNIDLLRVYGFHVPVGERLESEVLLELSALSDS